MKNTPQTNRIDSPIQGVNVIQGPSVPPAPDWLDQVAKDEYNRARDEIHWAGLPAINNTDPVVLVSYAKAWSDIRRLTLLIREQGEVITGEDGVPRLSPACLEFEAAQTVFLDAIGKLGFSPADRARLNGTYFEGNDAGPGEA